MIFLLCYLIVCAWGAGVLTVGALTKPGNGYAIGAICGILLAAYIGVALIGYVSEHPL